MQITLEKTKAGLFRATGDEVRLHVVGKTEADALRKAAQFLDDMQEIMAQRAQA